MFFRVGNDFKTRYSLQGRKREDAIKCIGMVVLEMISQSLNVTQRQKLYSHLGTIFTPGMTDLEHFGLLYTFSKMCPQNMSKN